MEEKPYNFVGIPLFFVILHSIHIISIIYMKYLEAEFVLNPYSETNADLLKALAGEGGFESFTDIQQGFKAYIQADDYCRDDVEDALQSFPLAFHFSYTLHEAEDRDWNEAWEKEEFAPVYLGPHHEIVIHDTLHPVVEPVDYNILINPQLAFGTGTHETTGMLLETLLKADLQGKTILDMGCGTGILGIFCCLRGTANVTAIDIDEWSVRNTSENARLNHVDNRLSTSKGDASTLPHTGVYDIIITNINRNILLRDLPSYAAALKKCASTLYLSGFYTTDVPALVEKAKEYGFVKVAVSQRNDWAMLKLYKH